MTTTHPVPTGTDRYGNASLRDVQAAWKRLAVAHHDEGRLGTLHWPHLPFDKDNHVQGMAAYGDLLLFTRNMKNAGHGHLLGGYHRSGKKADWSPLTTPHGYDHPGGIQVVGDFLVVGLEDSGRSAAAVCFYDLAPTRNGEEPRLLDARLTEVTAAGSVGMAHVDGSGGDSRYVLAVGDSPEVQFFALDRPPDRAGAVFTRLSRGRMPAVPHGGYPLVATASGVGRGGEIQMICLDRNGIPRRLYLKSGDGTWRCGHAPLPYPPGSTLRQVVTGAGNDGNLQVLELLHEGTLWLAYQLHSDGSWHRRTTELPHLGSSLVRMGAARGYRDDLQVVTIDKDGTPCLTYQRHNDGSWHSLTSPLPHPPVPFTDLTLARGAHGDLQVVLKGVDGHLYLIYQRNSDGSWHARDGALPIDPRLVVAHLASGTGPHGDLQVVFTAGGLLYALSQKSDGSWHGRTEPLPCEGFPALGRVAVAEGLELLQPGAGELDVIALGADGRAYRVSQSANGTWHQVKKPFPVDTRTRLHNVSLRGQGPYALEALFLDEKGIPHATAQDVLTGQWKPTPPVGADNLALVTDAQGGLYLVGFTSTEKDVLGIAVPRTDVAALFRVNPVTGYMDALQLDQFYTESKEEPNMVHFRFGAGLSVPDPDHLEFYCCERNINNLSWTLDFNWFS